MNFLRHGLLFLSFVGLTGCQTQNNLPSLPNNAIAYETQMQFQSGLVQVDVSLNNAEAKPFILDSGLPEMLLSEQQAELSGTINSGETIQLTGVGNSNTTADVVKNLLVDLGGIQWGAGAAVVLPQELSQTIEQNTGQAFYGVLGAQLFENYVVIVDFEAQQIILKPARDYQYEGEGEVLPLTFKDRKPFIEASVQVTKDSPSQKGLFLIDLGSTQALDIKQLGKSISELNWSQLPKRFSSGLGGEEQYPVSRLHQLQIGGQNISAPITSFELDKQTKTQEIRGRIGTQILSQYRLIFHYAQKELILEPTSSTFPKLETDMSGLRLQWDQKAEHPIKIAHVYPDTPADQEDIQKGDRILEINNEPVNNHSLHEIKQKFIGSPSATRELVIQRNGDTFTRSIQLKRLI